MRTREHRRLSREYGLTFRDGLEANEEIVEGQSFYLVDEEPQSKDLAGPVDDKPAKAASKGR